MNGEAISIKTNSHHLDKHDVKTFRTFFFASFGTVTTSKQRYW